MASGGEAASPSLGLGVASTATVRAPTRSGTILIIEDDPEVREHLELYLKDEGYDALTAIDGPAAFAMLADTKRRPDLVLADYNLPNGLTGVEVSQRLRRELDLQNSVHHSHRRHFNRRAARYRAPRLRAVQQARQVAGADARHRQASGKTAARRPRRVPSKSSLSLEIPKSTSSMTTIRFAGRWASFWKIDGCVVEAYASCEAFLEALSPRKERLPADRRLSAGYDRA